MLPRHAKSPCCAARIRRFGARRRQCANCERTWRIRSKRRGRPRKRISKNLLAKVFVERYPVRFLKRGYSSRSLPALWHHFRGALRGFVAKERRIEIPAGQLVLLVDGIWFRFKDRPWVLYQAALKPRERNTAFLLDPILLSGKESAGRWKTVIAAIPPELQQRIVAVVADDLRGMRGLAKQRGWVLQLCQVHLIRRLQVHRTSLRHALKSGPLRIEMYQLTRRILEQAGGPRLESDIAKLTELSRSLELPRRVRALFREFLHSISDYRAHLMRPLMGVPATNNSIESMGGIIRDMFRRSRAGSSPKSLQLWATALTRMRSQITCNGSGNQPN